MIRFFLHSVLCAFLSLPLSMGNQANAIDLNTFNAISNTVSSIYSCINNSPLRSIILIEYLDRLGGAEKIKNIVDKLTIPGIKAGAFAIVIYGSWRAITYMTLGIDNPSYINGKWRYLGGNRPHHYNFNGIELGQRYSYPGMVVENGMRAEMGQRNYNPFAFGPMQSGGQKINIFEGVSNSLKLANSKKAYKQFSTDTQGRIKRVVSNLKSEIYYEGLLTHSLLETSDSNSGVQASRYIAYQSSMKHMVLSGYKLVSKMYDLGSVLNDLFDWSEGASSSERRILVLTDFEIFAKPPEVLAKEYGLSLEYTNKLLTFLATKSSKFTIVGVSKTRVNLDSLAGFSEANAILIDAHKK